MPCVCVYRAPGLALHTRLDRSMPFEETDSRWPKDHVVDGDVDCCNLVITTARRRCGLVSNYFDLPLVLLVCARKNHAGSSQPLSLCPRYEQSNCVNDRERNRSMRELAITRNERNIQI